MKEYFRAQARLHPAMQPQDALKMAYQAAFGAEHLGADPLYARTLLQNELLACAPNPHQPLCEMLSDDTCRVNLSAWRARFLPTEWLLAMFLRSCTTRQDGDARFTAALAALDELAREGALPFGAEAWQQKKTEYLRQGTRPVHHSDVYRTEAAPAYRVVGARYARMLPLLTHLRGRRPLVIALDGRSASGKSTLAQDMAEIVGAGVIHMDDFFLPGELRTPERLAAPGGNVHYERFLADVLPHLTRMEPFAYPRFDCGKMAICGERQVPAAALHIVEGAYACHPALGDYMTLRVFSDIAPEAQQRRILARNGKEGWEKFRTRWIPLEEAYFAAFQVRQKADVVV